MKLPRDVKILLCSGTMAKREIEDFAHLAEWTHPRTTPLPRVKAELKQWGKAVNEGVDDWKRVPPGALSIFYDEVDAKEDDVTRARRGLRKRIFDTPGFIATQSNDVADCSLTIQCHQIKVPSRVDAIFAEMKETWESPQGDELDSGAALWAVCRMLACGFYKRWDPQAPKWWLAPRKAYNHDVRHTLSHNRRGLFSPAQVEAEILRVRDKHPMWKAYLKWDAVRRKFKPRSVPVWVDDYAIDWVEEWAEKNTGVIWTEWPDFGMRLARRLRVPYYGEQGEDKDGREIEAEKGNRSVVASIRANGTGRNLQTIWSRCLFTSAPPTGQMNEQAIGRIHRPGQEADEVIVDYMIASREQYNGFVQAMRDANFHSDVLQNDMRLSEGGKTADIILPRWKKTGGAWAEPTRD